jgi:hypothetical protein
LSDAQFFSYAYLRQLAGRRSSRSVISSAMTCAACASTFLRRAGLRCLIMSFTFRGMLTSSPSVSNAPNAHQICRRPWQ